MPSGSCFCTAIKFTFTGEPLVKALCHCTDCRKLSGSTYTTNLLIPSSSFTLLSGTPKPVPKTSDAGNAITNFFCGECGSPLWGKGAFGDDLVLRAGVVDWEEGKENGMSEGARPSVELFVQRRVGWVDGVEGAKGVVGMGKGKGEVEGV
ncbi:unnamed protein product [Periconia digitata]|uniref:CENP-V/GFA domain-containing protein n=1 Tax=Periconia digitata TaxID=1303443 RepID=A0A9W4UDL0_9PLEO|nr:unnamed protein product [Periconia digitata]